VSRLPHISVVGLAAPEGRLVGGRQQMIRCAGGSTLVVASS
jgi:hypothetical protein